jgi:hypothetical protein
MKVDAGLDPWLIHIRTEVPGAQVVVTAAVVTRGQEKDR